LSAVEEQMEHDDPKEVRLTFHRLTDQGYTEEEAKVKIATVLLEEIYDVLKENEQYKEERYVSRLRQLK